MQVFAGALFRVGGGEVGRPGAAMVAWPVAQRITAVAFEPAQHHQVIAIRGNGAGNARQFLRQSPLAHRVRCHAFGRGGGPLVHHDAVRHVEERHAGGGGGLHHGSAGERGNHRVQKGQCQSGADSAEQ